VSKPPEIPRENIQPNSVLLTWNKPSMPNGVITGYTVNIEVKTNTNTRKKRATAASVHLSCIPTNSTGMIPVGPQTTSYNASVGKLNLLLMWLIYVVNFILV